MIELLIRLFRIHMWYHVQVFWNEDSLIMVSRHGSRSLDTPASSLHRYLPIKPPDTPETTCYVKSPLCIDYTDAFTT